MIKAALMGANGLTTVLAASVPATGPLTSATSARMDGDYPAISAASNAPSSQQASRSALPGGPVTLTPREWEVGELLRDGRSTSEIAETLGVSPVTVRRHVGLLVNKLGAKNRQEAVGLLRAYGRR